MGSDQGDASGGKPEERGSGENGSEEALNETSKEHEESAEGSGQTIKPAERFRTLLAAAREGIGRRTPGTGAGGRKPLLVAALLLVALLFFGGYTYSMPDQDLSEQEGITEIDVPPDSRLYGLKRAYEDFKLDTAYSQERRYRLHLHYAERRLAEIGLLHKQGREARAREMANEYFDHIQRAKEIVENRSDQGSASPAAGNLTGANGSEESTDRLRKDFMSVMEEHSAYIDSRGMRDTSYGGKMLSWIGDSVASSADGPTERLDYVIRKADSIVAEAERKPKPDNIGSLMLDYNDQLSQMRQVYNSPELDDQERRKVAIRLAKTLKDHHSKLYLMRARGTSSSDLKYVLGEIRGFHSVLLDRLRSGGSLPEGVKPLDYER